LRAPEHPPAAARSLAVPKPKLPRALAPEGMTDYRKPSPQPPITKASEDRPALSSEELAACQVVDRTLATFAFSLPIELDDLAVVKTTLLAALGDAHAVEIWHAIRKVVVRVYHRHGGSHFCERVIRVGE
jgi:hypothetical protein